MGSTLTITLFTIWTKIYTYVNKSVKMLFETLKNNLHDGYDIAMMQYKYVCLVSDKSDSDSEGQ